VKVNAFDNIVRMYAKVHVETKSDGVFVVTTGVDASNSMVEEEVDGEVEMMIEGSRGGDQEVFIYKYLYIYTHIYLCMYICIFICINIHTYIYTYIFINVYIYTYTYIYRWARRVSMPLWQLEIVLGKEI
jgi:hypothetical protein